MENNGEYAVATISRSPVTDPKYLASFEEELCSFLSSGYTIAGSGIDGYTIYAIVFKKLTVEAKEKKVEP
jgi:hypothetical protein